METSKDVCCQVSVDPMRTPGHNGGDMRGSRWVLPEVGATFSLIFLEAKVVKKPSPVAGKAPKQHKKERGGCVCAGGMQSKRKP